MSAGPQLSSVATALAELTRRVTELADELARSERDDLAGELFEAERGLLAAGRRLGKVVDELA
ncbi:MAG: hypothetical protein M3P97_00270 [Actinomycetota bacterium]|jgi:hypothetical protein|nr:hypothetical protein [Actinomycetota bacterium]